MCETWDRIDAELSKRGKTWAWLAKKLDTNDQVVNNWKRRGVPPARFAGIANALDWSIDHLLSDKQAAGVFVPLTQVREAEAAVPSIARALPVVLDAIAKAPDKARLRTAVLALLDDDAPAYRQRVMELLDPPAMAEPPKPDLARHRM